MHAGTHGSRLSSGSRYRGEVVAKGGKAVFPYLVDVNTQTEMYDSERIINYLWSTYGKDAIPPLSYRMVNSPLYKMPSMAINFAIPALLRPLPRMGMIRTPSRKPEKASTGQNSLFLLFANTYALSSLLVLTFRVAPRTLGL